MQLKSYFYIAFKNCFSQKKTMFKIITAFTIVVFTTICFFCYNHSIQQQLHNIVTKSASECYIATSQKLNLKQYPDAKEMKAFSSLESNIDLDDVTLILNNDTSHQGTNDYSYDFEEPFSIGNTKEIYSVPFRLDAYQPDGVIFSKQDQEEFLEKYKNQSLLKAGNLTINKNSILISDYMLERFGISASSKLIGSKITLINHRTNEEYCHSLTLTGIINSNIFYTENNTSRAQIILSDEHQTNFSSPEYYYYSDDYSSTYHLFLELQSNQIDCHSSTLLEMYHTIENQQIIVSKVVSVILFALFLALFVSILTVLYFYSIQQKSYKQMLLALGMTTRSIYFISLLELVYHIIISMCLGLGLSLAFMHCFNLYCSSLSLQITYDSSYLLCLLAMTASGLFLLSVIITFIEIPKKFSIQ